MQVGKFFGRLALLVACVSQSSVGYATESAFGFAQAPLSPAHDDGILLAQSGGRAAVNGSTVRRRKPATVGTLQMILSLAWEGRHLRPENLSAIDQLRKRYPHLKVAHFISPAYFVRDPSKQNDNAQIIKQRILPGDSVGLLLNGWKSVANAADVSFRAHPTFWGSPLREVDCQQDCGLEVPVNVYPSLDLSKLIRFGIQTLEQHGFGRPVAIQAGGWVASPQVIESALAEGIRYDFSGVPVPLIFGRTRHFPMLSWVSNLWSHIQTNSEPYPLSDGSDAMIEVPQSLAAIDYLNEKDVMPAIDAWLALATKRGKGERQTTVTLGMYQETSDMMRAMTTQILNNLHEAALREKIAIEGVSLPGPNAISTAPALASENLDSSTPVANATNVISPPTVEPPLSQPNRGMLKEPPKVH